MAKISYKEKNGITVYRVGRKIKCFREGRKCYIGRPSDHTIFGAAVISEEKAHERCIEMCQDLIGAAMQYSNPVAYHAHKIINSL